MIHDPEGGTERPVKKGPGWRLGFAVFGLFFAAWVGYLALDNFAKVHGEYRQVRESRLPGLIGKIVRQELVAECRKEAQHSDQPRPVGAPVPDIAEDACRSFPESVVAERTKAVAENLLADEKRFRRKLVVFYITFGLFFIILPLGFLYLLLAFLVWVFKDMKFVK